MGGATGNGTITKPAAATGAYFTVDTVSGDIIVRGYAEDNQRVARVDLEFFDEANSARRSTVTILTQATKSNNGALQAAGTTADARARVRFTETIDLNLHRVEWAYVWKSEDIPGGAYTVGNYNVRAIAFNANSTPRTTADGTTVPTNENVHTSKRITRSGITTANRTTYDSFNTEFPASAGNFYRYNDTRVNIRPYITGFLRNQDNFSHNIRSRQGRYIFARGETPVIAGFNLRSTAGNTTLTMGGADLTTRALNSNAERTTYVVNTAHKDLAYDNVLMTNRYRMVTGSTAALTTGEGLITLTVNSRPAVNTGSERQKAAGNDNRPLAIQPWNKEYSAGKEGSELWDDFTMVHIWRSDENMTANFDRGRFSKGRFNITHPSMSINPTDGTLWASHQEGGNWPVGVAYSGGGSYFSSNNNNTTTNTNNVANRATANDRLTQVASWSEHMTHTNIFVSGAANGTENFTLWNASSSETMSHVGDRWGLVGGMFLWGPISSTTNNNGNPRISNYPRTSDEAINGTTVENPSGFRFPTSPNTTGHYVIESLWYNGAKNSRTVTDPVSLQQFHNPNIVTSGTGTDERIHISYYDEKDGSLKYRYNRRGNTGWSGTATEAGGVDNEGTARLWVNLDGGADVDDNAPITGRPGRQRSNGNTNYSQGDSNVRLYYTRLDSMDPTQNGNGTAGGATANYAYYQATSATYKSYTLQEANGGTAPANRYLREILVQNGSYVRSGDVVYRFGPQTGGTLINITAQATGFIVLNTRTTITSTTNNDTPAPITLPVQFANTDPVYRIYQVDATRIRGGETRLNTHINAGRYNSIDVTGGTTNGGWPVIAYYDETNQGLKIAVSNNTDPTSANNWKVFNTGDIFTGNNSSYAPGTGEYVSLKINASTNAAAKTFHIAALNSLSKNVVYITGTLNTNATLANYTLSNITVQVVDSVGNVGSWCRLSLDAAGNPWIAYMDESYRGSRDGVKVAYRNTTRFYKGSANNYNGQDQDVYGTSITGWEAMHVPTQFRVENAQLGMERFPTIRNTGATRPANGSAGLPTFAAVGFLGEDYYRIAYYVE
jgi:hypothetical protein